MFRIRITALTLALLAFAGTGNVVAQTSPAVLPVAENALRAHLSLLASDLFEGRGTGQRGGDLTVAYLEAQAMATGLQPANGKTYRQPVSITGVRTLATQSKLQTHAGNQTFAWKYGDDWVWWSGNQQARQSFDAPVVFVGYGIQAPEENWDDLKGLDCHGKILLMLVNEPQPTLTEPQRFDGASLTYYGRWSYKFEQAKRCGAAGALLIHTDQSAGYGWSVVRNGGTNEHFRLSGKETGPALQGWITDAAARQWLSAGGQQLDSLREAAEKADFQPVLLNARLSGELHSQVRQIEQFNVAGLVPGTDPVLRDELVIYSAHWDHLGKTEGSGDVIYNGAIDNASGTAALLAMAKTAVQHPAKRTQMFLWVAAEEQGLLGSAAYVEKPLWPLAKTAAALNLDAMNFVGITRDMGVQGSERSSLAQHAAHMANRMQLQLAAPRADTGGGYFRSDHFSFAKAGVPAFSIGSGRDYVHNSVAFLEKARAYGKRYHQVTDEYDPAWDLSGMVQQAMFTLNLGQDIANAAAMPVWRPGDPFGAIRKNK